MGWIIQNQRVCYEYNGKFVTPCASDIFTLISDQPNYSGELPDNLTSSTESLGIRFSRIGAQIVTKVIFNEQEQSLLLNFYARKGKKDHLFPHWEDILPDSLIINDTWYNLLSNYDETKALINEAGINTSAEITLKQYIILRRNKSKYSSVIFIDEAEKVLINHPSSNFECNVPASINANLYPYQIQGYRWMQFISRENCGCILGDEMGLGKTLQVIALIAEHQNAQKGPALVIAPVSLLENWKREIAKFTSGLNTIIHHGTKRTGLFTELEKYDVVIISYGTAISDQSLLKMVKWDLLVVDEAQNIKNPFAKRTLSIKGLPRETAIAVTGTPFENHVSDLWSLMDFIAPNCFGTLSSFEKEFLDDIDGAIQLEPYLSPLLLRRKVDDVAQDLPERVDIPLVLTMSEKEISDYENVRIQLLNDFTGKNVTLPVLQKLRMYCTHPSLIESGYNSDPKVNSTKYQRLCEILEEICELNEKVILFTSYNKMFDILKEDISLRFNIPVLTINGATPPKDRQSIIDNFSSLKGTALLVLNPRAAGTGLNITAATRVIHYNLEWNPALEDQASARAYRRGQTKTVFIYRFYYKNTVEEIINERIDKKREMFGAAIVGTDGTKENSKDILKALTISPIGDYYE